MYKLSATDAAFLYNETPNTPMHIASVQLMELPEGLTPEQFVTSLRTYLMQRIHRVPYLSNRLMFTPYNLDHPVWVKDKNLKIENHVRLHRVAEPGGLQEMEAAVAELHAQLLDRARPLWDMVVLHGLADGRVAYYNRIHHACIDGMAGQAATMLLMDENPAHPQLDTSDALVEPEAYGTEELLVAAWESILKSQLDRHARALNNFEAVFRLGRRMVSPRGRMADEWTPAPTTRLNGAVTAQRQFAVGELDLAEIKRLSKMYGGTVNDLFLTICGGALRRYLARFGEVPEATLQAGCPVSLRAPNDRSMNNQVSMMRVALGTHIDNPLARLRYVRSAATNAKQATAETSALMPGNVSDPGLPLMMQLAAASADAWAGVGLVPASPINVVVSNVPGPRNTLYSNGARMCSHYPVSIPAHGVGVNITVQSYVDTLYFGITACARALPDAGRLRNDMLAEFRALRDLVVPPELKLARGQSEAAQAIARQEVAGNGPAKHDAAEAMGRVMDKEAPKKVA